jgi:bifunctional DNA-binding transcriptional regulator/antitoxin component of YhaV-PrlF toxin-antitoxin module
VKAVAMSRISRRNQITIPVEALRAAGLRPGDDVRVVGCGPGRVEVVRVDDLVAGFAGTLSAEQFPDRYLEELRAEWA